MSAAPAANFLPDFCRPPAILQLLLVSQILAILLTLGLPGESLIPGTRLVLISLYLHWITLLSAGALCWLRRRMVQSPAWLISLAAFCVLLAVSLIVSEMSFQLGRLLGRDEFSGEQSHAHFLLRIALLASIVSLLLLRYFYVMHAWRREVEALAEARYAALQARIRPHFFFNALNSVAALITINPGRAEELLEDLSELFRAILKSQDPWTRLKDEIAMARTYLRIEELRLGERLRLEWRVPQALDELRLPLLCLQPLLENGIYHGIEQRPEGGTLRIEAQRKNDDLCITISNPLPPGPRESSGSRMAQDNIRQRLRLLYDDRASLTVHRSQGEYRAELRVPV